MDIYQQLLFKGYQNTCHQVGRVPYRNAIWIDRVRLHFKIQAEAATRFANGAKGWTKRIQQGSAFGTVLSTGQNELRFELFEVLSRLSRLNWLIRLMVLIFVALSRSSSETQAWFCRARMETACPVMPKRRIHLFPIPCNTADHTESAFPTELFLAVFCNSFGTVFCSLSFFATRFHTFVTQICFLWGGV